MVEFPDDIPGHESGCVWEVKKVCICDILWQTRREAYNEGWNDGFDEGSMWIGVDVSGSNS